MPFYASPGQHTSNLITGAELGAAAGLAAVLYKAFTGGEPIEGEQAAASESGFGTLQSSAIDPVLMARANLTVPLNSIRLPLVSVTW